MSSTQLSSNHGNCRINAMASDYFRERFTRVIADDYSDAMRARANADSKTGIPLDGKRWKPRSRLGVERGRQDTSTHARSVFSADAITDSEMHLSGLQIVARWHSRERGLTGAKCRVIFWFSRQMKAVISPLARYFLRIPLAIGSIKIISISTLGFNIDSMINLSILDSRCSLRER